MISNTGAGAEDTEPTRAREWADLLGSTDDEDEIHNVDEATAAGTGVVVDVVSAVDYLSRGLRPRFTIWHAIEEALRWFTNEEMASRSGAPLPDTDGLDPTDPDPLRTQLRLLLEHLDDRPARYADEVLQQALRRWARTMATSYNRGYAWPDPVARQQFPPVAL